jgi:hypothetical protein
MHSAILTKVNTVQPRNFAQQCEWMSVEYIANEADKTFLIDFITRCHKNADKIKNHGNIAAADVFTSKGAYRYVLYAKHIVRTDLNTTKKKYYEIS